MKKVLLAAVAAGLLSTSAMALDSVITQVWVKSASSTVVFFDNTGACRFGVDDGMSADYSKSFLAAVLTAKSSSATVVINKSSGVCTDIFVK